MSHLRLVPDPDQPKPVEPEPKKRRRPQRKDFLTPAEAARLAALLRNLRRRYRNWKCVADLVGTHEQNVRMIARRRPGYNGSFAVAFRACRVAGIPLEQMLTGGLHEADRCPTCSQPWPENEGRTENR